MSSKIPPALSSIVRLPSEASLILLTGVQNATSNWLVLRYIYAILNSHGPTPSSDPATSDSPPSVVLCSYLRDMAFWHAEAKRLGLDLARLSEQGRFEFLDGLTSLFTPSGPTNSSPTTSWAPPRAPVSPSPPVRSPLPVRRAPPAPTPSSPPPISAHPPPSALADPSLPALLARLTTPAAPPSTPRILILDAPSLLLTTSPATASTLLSALLTLRTHFHAIVVSLPVDAPLLAASPVSSFNPRNQWQRQGGTGLTPLDAQNAAFLVGVAYQADVVVGCRGLETGVAGDVSGVVRVTRGGAWESGGEAVEGEWLYFVGGDGGVRVWERREGVGN